LLHKMTIVAIELELCYIYDKFISLNHSILYSKCTKDI
jgi:hypothetical protein